MVSHLSKEDLLRIITTVGNDGFMPCHTTIKSNGEVINFYINSFRFLDERDNQSLGTIWDFNYELFEQGTFILQ